MAEFCAGPIAYATEFDSIGVPAPRCFKFRKSPVEAAITDENAVCWSCSR